MNDFPANGDPGQKIHGLDTMSDFFLNLLA